MDSLWNGRWRGKWYSDGTGSEVRHVHRVFPGDRAFVRTLSVKTALDLIRRACD